MAWPPVTHDDVSQAIDDLFDVVEGDSLLMPEPGGPGVDDTPALLALAAQAEPTGKAVMLRSGTYRLLSQEVSWPNGVPLVGQGMGTTTISCNANSSLRFGVLDGSGGRRYPIVRDFSIHGSLTATSPLRVGHTINSHFMNIKVVSAGAGGPGLLVETAQNCLWTNIQLTNCLGDGVRWDYGPNNHTRVHWYIGHNAGYGEVFTRSGPAPAGTSVTDVARNFHTYGGLNEDNDLGQILISAGIQFEWVAAQVSGNDTTASVHVTAATGSVTDITFLGGQLKAGAGAGVALRVDGGRVLLDGGVLLRSATPAVQIGDGGRVVVGRYALAEVTTEFAATGTSPLRALIQRVPTRQTARATANMTINNSATLVDVPGLAVTLDANAEYEFDLYLAASGDTTADLQIGWTVPTGATMSWTADSPVSTASASATTIVRQHLAAGSTPTIGMFATTNVSLCRGVVTTGSTGGTLQLQASQATATVADTVINGNTRLGVSRVL